MGVKRGDEPSNKDGCKDVHERLRIETCRKCSSQIYTITDGKYHGFLLAKPCGEAGAGTGWAVKRQKADRLARAAMPIRVRPENANWHHGRESGRADRSEEESGGSPARGWADGCR